MIEVMLVDDHAVVREGYRRMLQTEDDLRVVAEAADATEALNLWRQLKPQVMVIDLALPGMGGLELITRLRQRDPQCRCLAFSMHRDPLWATQALKAGALGYVTKSSDPALLVHAVREVAAQRRIISPDLAGEVAARLLDEAGGAAQGLTPRELEVLRLLLAGTSAQQIAEALHLSVKTVHNLHYQVKAKFGTSSDFELARMAWREGWTD
ncbi:response regulator transcription factor [Ideonella sp. DXS22W]|uniref:Response regulator transcription factor n=1 Tax=Pseudaquabacterium inlustre TaxID=2984192 RepID=A0ABU9CF22_9BURK